MCLKEKSKLVSLKYIDIHTHGAYGVDFNNALYNEIKALLKELYKKNIVAICPTLVGDSTENIKRQLRIFREIKNKQIVKKEDETFLIGVHLEGSFLSPSKPGIQDKNNFLKPTVENFKNLVGEYEDIIKIVTIAPEEDVDLIEYLNNKNIITQAGHSNSETTGACIGVTHLFNAMPQIHHRNKSIVLEALCDNEKYCEIIADLKHISKEALSLVLKMKSKDKILLVSDSLPVANYDKDIIFCNKKIYKNAKDKNGILAGSNQTLDEICENLIEKEILSKDEVLKMAYFNQIEYLKLSNDEIDVLKQ